MISLEISPNTPQARSLPYEGPESLRTLERLLEPEQSVGIRAPKGWHTDYPDEFRVAIRGLRQVVLNCRQRYNTAAIRSTLLVENTIKNLPRLSCHGLLDTHSALFAGRIVVVAGAGPSLEQAAPQLVHRHAVVIATNSAAQYLRAHGVTPDCVLAIESVDASDQLADLDVPILAEISAHPANVRGPLVFGQQPTWSALSRALDVRPVPYAGNVTAAAVALAAIGGAARIVLVGQDLAYPDGQLYAGDPRRARIEGGLLVLPERPESDARYQRAGLEPPAGMAALLLAETPGRVKLDTPPSSTTALLQRARTSAGLEVPTTPMLQSFRVWLEQAAAQMPVDIQLLNASPSVIAGWAATTLEDALRHDSPDWDVPVRAVRRVRIDELLRGIVASAGAVAEACGRPDRDQIAALCARAPLVECHAVAGLQKAMKVQGLRQRSEAVYAAIRDSAHTVSRLASAEIS